MNAAKGRNCLKPATFTKQALILFFLLQILVTDANDKSRDQNLNIHHRNKRAVTTRTVRSTQTIPENVNNDVDLFDLGTEVPDSAFIITGNSADNDNLFTVTEGKLRLTPGLPEDERSLFDYDRFPIFTVMVNATEINDVTAVVILTVELQLSDINDELPSFTNEPTPFLATVTSQTDAGSSVYTLTATDPDTNADLVMVIGTVTPDSGLSRFRLQIETVSGNTLQGTIITVGNDDFPSDTEYSLTVSVTDRANAVNTPATTSRFVRVLVGSRAPQIYQTSYKGFLYETRSTSTVSGADNTPLEIKVLQFQTGQLEYALLDNGQPSTLFRVQENGQIISLKALDYERESTKSFNYVVQVTETISGNLQLSSTSALTIELQDENDNQPIFSAPQYFVNVPEDVSLDQTILMVTATDLDSGANGEIEFEIIGTSFGVITTKTTTNVGSIYEGQIVVKGVLDFDDGPGPNYVFIVRAKDKGNVALSSTAQVTVSVTNVNDNDPVLISNSTSIASSAGSKEAVVTVLQASDKDGDKFIFKFKPNSDQYIFTLEESGLMRTSSNIPSNQDAYKLDIQIVDDGSCCGSVLQNTANVVYTVNIRHSNTYKPNFDNCSSYDSIAIVKEQSPVGTPVIQVKASDPDRGVNGIVEYSMFFATLDPAKSLFAIDETTGNITVKGNIIRDQAGYIQVTVRGANTGAVPLMEGWCTFRVTIQDINDHPPRFSLPEFTASISVAAAPFTVLRQMQATDEDVGENANITYSLGTVSNFFSINSLTGIVSLQGALDVTTPKYNLTIVANDNGVDPGPLTGTTTLVVTVNAEGSASPEWVGVPDNPRYSVSEVAEPGFVIATFTCNSMVDNPRVDYIVYDSVNTISVSSPVFFASQYNINGKYFMNLTLSSRLDYLLVKEYRISLVCRNSGSTSQETEINAVVTVEDANNLFPVFEGLSGCCYAGTVPENATSGAFVIEVSATDRDETSPFNNVTFSIEGAEVSKFRVINLGNNRAKIETSEPLDREKKPSYTLTVNAQDGAPAALPLDPSCPECPNQAQARTINIHVTDINDNSPEFPQTLYITNVSESVPVNTDVRTVIATDEDTVDQVGLNYFFVEGNVNNAFSILDVTGQIRVARTLDYEDPNEPKTYRLKLQATDSVGHAAETEVHIIVIDINDQKPVFNKSVYEIEDAVEEEDISITRANNVSIVKVSAIDGDIARPQTDIRYYLTGSYTSGNDQLFAIDEKSGEIFVIGALDRDRPNPAYTLNVRAEDERQNPNAGYATVRVTPSDINDNKPIFDSNFLQGSVDEHSDLGTLVMTAVARDIDAGLNGTVNYKIAEDALQPDALIASFLSIDLDSGEISTNTFKENLDRESTESMKLVLVAYDLGYEPQSSTGTVTITLLDINDQSPYFEEDEYTVTISEHTTSGAILTITALDNDTAPENKNLIYSLSNEPAYFIVQSVDNKAILSVASPVDYEKDPHEFVITLNVADSVVTHTNSTTIKITVLDYNDNPPIFVESFISKTLREEEDPGVTVATFSATDADSGINGEFEYSIVRESDPWYEFYVDPQLGTVTTRKKLDRELKPSRRILIMAKDKGEIPLSSTADLHITLTDINDNAPRFREDYLPKIEENQVLSNTLVVEILATDPDDSPFGAPFGFSFPSPCDACNHFTLDFNPAGDGGDGSASIRSSFTFDREVQKQYYLPIVMWDMDGSNDPRALTATNTLTIVIGDENDNKHGPGHQDIFAYNYEGKFGDLQIGRVYAEDPDDWDLPDKTFTFLSPEILKQYFSVSKDTGMITMKSGVPSNEDGDPYTFKVNVYDQKWKNTVECSVAVTVGNLSDQAVRLSGAVRLLETTAEDFILKPPAQTTETTGKSKYDLFLEELASLLGYPSSDNIQIVSLTDGKGYLDVRYSAHGSPYLNPSQVESVLMINQAQFEKGVGLNIQQVPVNLCLDELYDDGCYTYFNVTGQPRLVNANGTSYVGAETSMVAQSGCVDSSFPEPVECRGDYCFNGGTCSQDNWGKLICQCPSGYDGPRCQQRFDSFDGNTVSFYKGLSICAQGRTSIDFITKADDGIIMYFGPISNIDLSQDNQDYLILELRGGYPKLRLNLGAGEVVLNMNGLDSAGVARLGKLSDGQWHHIDIDRDNQMVEIIVDHCKASSVTTNGTVIDWSPCRISGIVPGPDILLNVKELLQLGGRYPPDNPYPTGVIGNGFIGCLRNLVHNEKLYDLNYKTIPLQKTVEQGCPRESRICELDKESPQCGVNSYCDSQWLPTEQVVKCTCHPGWYGTKCENETPVRDLKEQSFFKWQIQETLIAETIRDHTIDLMFRTRQTSGNLFTMTNANQDTILLQIVDGKLNLYYDMGEGEQRLSLDNVQANTGQWHHVHMERHGSEVSLAMDGGEGRNYNYRRGLLDVNVHFESLPYISVGARVPPIAAAVDRLNDDLTSTCIQDVRYQDKWLPMTIEQNSEPVAGGSLIESQNTEESCTREDCSPDPCPAGQMCYPLWEDHECRCLDGTHFSETGVCVSLCLPNPCFANVSCTIADAQVSCICPSGWSGTLCNELAVADGDSALSAGAIAGIVLAILIILALILALLIYFLCCREREDEKFVLKVDPEDDDFLRENVMFYDEEGAGEEDHRGYDLSLLTKPINEASLRPMHSQNTNAGLTKQAPTHIDQDRPDVGDFINNRIKDAEDPDDDPFKDSTREYAFEGENSEAGSLSSLATSSSDGSQTYDYLSGWGDKFARLADLYGAGQDLED